jgi:TIR domain
MSAGRRTKRIKSRDCLFQELVCLGEAYLPCYENIAVGRGVLSPAAFSPMADIFISWSSPDKEIVLPVIRRLERHGLDVTQFEADPDAGSIEQSVQAYIENARLMVMFVSEKTNERDWLKREAEWAAYRQTEQRRKIEPVLKMIPILIGNVDLDKLNVFLAKNQDQKRLTVPPPSPQAVNAAATGDVQPAEPLAPGAISEAALQNIVLRICDTLDLPNLTL